VRHRRFKARFLLRPSIIRLHVLAVLAGFNENYGREDQIMRRIGAHWAVALDQEYHRRKRTTTPLEVTSND